MIKSIIKLKIKRFSSFILLMSIAKVIIICSIFLLIFDNNFEKVLCIHHHHQQQHTSSSSLLSSSSKWKTSFNNKNNDNSVKRMIKSSNFPKVVGYRGGSANNNNNNNNNIINNLPSSQILFKRKGGGFLSFKEKKEVLSFTSSSSSSSSSSSKIDNDINNSNNIDINNNMNIYNYEDFSPGTSSLTASIFNLCKNVMGAGLLSLPAGLIAGSGTGLLPALAMLIFSCVSSAYTFILVGKATEVTKAKNFKELWARSIGEETAWIVDLTITLLTFGVCIMYGAFLGDLLSLTFKGFDWIPSFLYLRSNNIILVTSLLLFPLALLKDLSALQYSSYLGMAAVFYTIVFVGIRYMDGSYEPNGEFFNDIAASLQPDHTKIPEFQFGPGSAMLLNMLSTAFLAHTNAVKYYAELQDRSVKRFSQLVMIAMSLAASIFGTLMVLGHWTFGLNAQGLILNNYATRDKLAVIARLGTGISIIGAHPLLFQGFRESFFSLLSTINGPDFEITPTFSFTSTIAVLAMATIIAIASKNVGIIVAFIGCTFGSCILYTYPAMLMASTIKRYDLKESLTPSRLVILLGILATIFGTSITIIETWFSHLLL